MSQNVATAEEYGMKLGPIKILKGVSPINILTLFFASFFGIAVMSYMNAGQPLIFGEILGVEEDDFGRLAGTLTFYHEIVVLICIAPIGALSDRIGRRPLYMMAPAADVFSIPRQESTVWSWNRRNTSGSVTCKTLIRNSR